MKSLVSGWKLGLAAAFGCSMALSPEAQADSCWDLSPIFADGFEYGVTSIWGAPGVCPQGWVILPGTVPMGFMLVPAGVFEMGSPPTERGRETDETLHEVTLTRDYWMSTTEVTQAQWQSVFAVNPSGFPLCGGTCPVESVNWWEAVSFANAVSAHQSLQQCYSLTGCTGQIGMDFDCTGIAFVGLECTGYRLPTEAEWERAARAGTQTRFSHGDVLGTDDDCEVPSPHENAMWWCGNDSPVSGTKPVAGKLPNGYGLYDMHGNVWEWTWDIYEFEFGAGPVTDPTGPISGFDRNVRGGHWGTYADHCRSARRLSNANSNRGSGWGFRLVRSSE